LRWTGWCATGKQARKAGLPIAADFGEFFRDYEWMGVQRHLKVLGIFARLWHRDGKDGYLKDMPLVARYLRRACERYSRTFAAAQDPRQGRGQGYGTGCGEPRESQ
jgi:aminoglycoside/choline kinase family phosphotransferase